MIFPCGPVSRIDVVPAPVVFPDAAAFKLVWVKMLLVLYGVLLTPSPLL